MTSSQPDSDDLVVSYDTHNVKAHIDKKYLYYPLYVNEDAYRSTVI